MLLVSEVLAYENEGTCSVDRPRWLSLVFRAVGLIGDGETAGRRTGDFAVRVVGAVAGTDNASLGRVERGSILAIVPTDLVLT